MTGPGVPSDESRMKVTSLSPALCNAVTNGEGGGLDRPVTRAAVG